MTYQWLLRGSSVASSNQKKKISIQTLTSAALTQDRTTDATVLCELRQAAVSQLIGHEAS
jgi:hypothetical protein